MNSRSGRLAIEGAEIAWSVSGSGPVVVWCHGLGSSTRGQERSGLFDWSSLEDDFTLLRYDARGHGASTGRPIPADYNWSRLSSDLLELLDHTFPGLPVFGVGSSMGSATLVKAALQDWGRFRGLVLTAPSTLHFTRPAQRGNYLALAERAENHGQQAFLDQRASYPVARIFQESTARLEWEVPEELTAAVLRGAAESDYPPAEELAKVVCPTLVLAWASDGAHPLSAAGTVADVLPHTSLEVANTIEEVRQWPHRVSRFLARLAPEVDPLEPNMTVAHQS